MSRFKEDDTTKPWKAEIGNAEPLTMEKLKEMVRERLRVDAQAKEQISVKE